MVATSLWHPPLHLDRQKAGPEQTVPLVPLAPLCDHADPDYRFPLNYFVPPQPTHTLSAILRPYADCSELTSEEVPSALSMCSPSSAPGTYTIPSSVWKTLYCSAPTIFPSLLGPFLRYGHHPSSLKKANGVVLDNPGKPSYDSSAFFRIIVLLQTVLKILERMVPSRLSAIARHVGLIHPNQCGSLPSLSSFDACTSLVDTVHKLQRPALKLSSLFLDIKGGFDNVDVDILCSSLHSKEVNYYLVSRVGSFLTGRSCRLLFQGSPRVFSPLSVSTPQGSPVSPLLFVIYVAPLHVSIERGLVLSYVDDFSLTISSPSYRSNSRTLQSAFGPIRAIGHTRKVDFSILKIELIHWCTPMQRDPPTTPRPPTVALDGQLFYPSSKLRWLGYWFVPNLASSAHFSRRLALSEDAMASVKRLSTAGKGIPPHLGYRLAYYLKFLILSYGADLYCPTKGLLGKMDVHSGQVQRWATNCFHSTPILILVAGSCLPPLCVLLKHKRQMAALQLVSSPPTINPASARLCRTFPSLLRARAPDSHRALCIQLAPNIMPLNWKTPLPSPPLRTHLLVDALAHLTHSLLDGFSYAPLIGSTLLPDLPSLPSAETILNAYQALRRKARSLMKNHWCSIPLPNYYSY